MLALCHEVRISCPSHPTSRLHLECQFLRLFLLVNILKWIKYVPCTISMITMLSFITVSFFGVAAADVLFTYPRGGEVLSAGSYYNITWIESNIVPLIEDLELFTIVLYSGPNSNIVSSILNLFPPILQFQTTVVQMEPDNSFLSDDNSTVLASSLYFDKNVGPNSENNA